METQSRPRLDSIHGMMSEQRDFKRLKTSDARWKKVEKSLMQPQTQLILIEVPKGFDVTTLSGKVDLKKRLQKAQRKSNGRDSQVLDNVKMEIEVLNPDTDNSKSFNGAAHVTQLLTLLPNTEDKNDKSNLKVTKGLSGYIKVTHQLLNEENSKPQPQHIVHTIPRKYGDISTDVSVRSKWEESDHEEAEVKIKKDKKAKK